MGSGTSKQEQQPPSQTTQNRDLPNPSQGPHPASKPRANAATAAAERLTAALKEDNDSGPKVSGTTSFQHGYTLEGVQEEEASDYTDASVGSQSGPQGTTSFVVSRTQDNVDRQTREDPLSTTKIDMEKYKRANKEKLVDPTLGPRGAPRYSIHSDGPRLLESRVPRSMSKSNDDLGLKPVSGKNESGLLDPSDEEFMSEILKETEFLVHERYGVGAV